MLHPNNTITIPYPSSLSLTLPPLPAPLSLLQPLAVVHVLRGVSAAAARVRGGRVSVVARVQPRALRGRAHSAHGTGRRHQVRGGDAVVVYRNRVCRYVVSSSPVNPALSLKVRVVKKRHFST